MLPVEDGFDIGGRLLPEGETEVGRADVEGIDAIDRCDSPHLGQSPGGLHHDNHERRLVERPDPAGLHPVGTAPLRGVPGGVHRGCCIISRLYQRDDHPGRPQVEGTPDPAQVEALHSNQPGHAIRGHDGESGCVEPPQVDPVLGVDTDEVGPTGGGGVDYCGMPGHRPEPVDLVEGAEGGGTRHGA